MILLVLAFFAGGKAEVHVAFKSGKVVFFEFALASLREALIQSKEGFVIGELVSPEGISALVLLVEGVKVFLLLCR
jgi:hypothetical protein